jgi:hypothetical protein
MSTAGTDLVSLVSRWSQNATNCTCNSAGETRKTNETRFFRAYGGCRKTHWGCDIQNVFLQPPWGITWSHWSYGLTLIYIRFFLLRPNETNQDQNRACGALYDPPTVRCAWPIRTAQ